MSITVSGAKPRLRRLPGCQPDSTFSPASSPESSPDRQNRFSPPAGADSVPLTKLLSGARGTVGEKLAVGAGAPAGGGEVRRLRGCVRLAGVGESVRAE